MSNIKTSELQHKLNLNLWFECHNGDFRRAQTAIDAGADVNYSHDGVSCLQVPALRWSYILVELLITAGADKETALIWAAEKGHGGCVDMMLTASADKEAKNMDGFTALVIAALNGHDKCVKLLVKSGANKEAIADGKTALMQKNKRRIAAEAAEAATAEAAFKAAEADDKRRAIKERAAAAAEAAAAEKAAVEDENRARAAATAAAEAAA
jgi:ankyrin repeat protein